MRDYLSKIFTGDKILWGIIFILFIISGVEMFSAISSSAYKAAARGSNHLAPFFGHLLHLGVGGLALIIIQKIPFDKLRLLSFVAVIISIILLILTPFLGKEVNDAKRAIEVGGFELQTIELGKFALIVCLSEILGRNYKQGDPLLKEKFPMKSFIIMVSIIGIFCGLILIQNLSTAVILGGISLFMMIIAEVDWKKIGMLIGIVLCAVLLVYGVNKALPEKYQLERFSIWEDRVIEIFASKDEENAYKITDENRQIINSEIAIAKGYKPCGPGNSTQRDYLPLAFSDFIYAILIEEWGLIGGLFTILLYLCILARAGRVVRKCDRKNLVEALMVIGLSLLIVLQAFVSMGVTVHLGPVTGQQLPLISRGGMGIMLTCCYLGIIINISNKVLNENKEEEEPSDNTIINSDGKNS
ncbi:MAG: FtsW/RodA/SpoVE family cell cycle protein [Paludibacteraceae bacterium]|nr:FtsW/RodA/SpoVE family cell cycle protein [Paludibacteraceae bacterium]